MARFYGHFAAAYGTFWLVMLGTAILSGSHIDAGAFGLIGFPLIAAVYAIARISGSPGQEREIEVLRRRISELELRTR